MLSSQDIPPPVTNTAYGLTLSEDTPTTSLFEAGDPRIERPTKINEDYPIVQHPNGSEGWLPAEDLPVNPPSPKTAGMTAGTAGVSRHGTTATRHSTFAGSPGVAAGTAGVDVGAGSPVIGAGPQSPVVGNGAAGVDTGPAGVNGGASLGRTSSRRSVHTTADGRIITGGAFVNGAGTTGPYATAARPEDDDLAVRAQEAHATLTPRQRSKIAKSEAKNGRKLSRIIKQEGKVEKKSLAIAIDELANLQKHQKAAVKSEARIQASHTKLTNAFKKTEAAYLNAKMQYETAQAEVEAEARTLETLKANSREATEKVSDKSAEVDALRRTLAVDEREREVKLGELKGRRSSFWG